MSQGFQRVAQSVGQGFSSKFDLADNGILAETIDRTNTDQKDSRILGPPFKESTGEFRLH